MAGTDPDRDGADAHAVGGPTPPSWYDAATRSSPIMAAPRFPQPMSVPLTAISQELLLPGSAKSRPSR